MFEKVNPCHPDKVADRIAGAIVDLAYKKEKNPKAAIEVLIGHGDCFITGEASCTFDSLEIDRIVRRIDSTIQTVTIKINKQDVHLAKNQEGKGIFHHFFTVQACFGGLVIKICALS